MKARRSIAIILALLLVAAFSGISYAQAQAEKKQAAPAQAEKKQAAPAKAASKEKTLTAAVKGINLETKTVTLERKIKGKVQETTVTVSPETKISKGKETLVLDAIKAADRLRVKYVEGEGGKLLAKSIEVRLPKAKKGK